MKKVTFSLLLLSAFINLHAVQAESSRTKPCSSEQDCAQVVELFDGTVVGAVIYRTVSDFGSVQEYIKDNDSKLIWSPEATTGGRNNDGKVNFQEAIDYCKAKNDLALKWSLPTKEEFRVAFNPSNPDNSIDALNEAFMTAIYLYKSSDGLWRYWFAEGRFLWSSSVYEKNVDLAWGFHKYADLNIGRLDMMLRDFLYSYYSVRCVGR